MPRVLNKRHRNIPKDAVYVGRPSKWGNPFVVAGSLPYLVKMERHRIVVDQYRAWIQTQPQLLACLPELKGKDLICWCFPLPCHADVLLELANREGSHGRT